MGKKDRRGGIEHHREDCPCNACRGRRGIAPQIMIAFKLSGEAAAWLRDLAARNGSSPGRTAKAILLDEHEVQTARIDPLSKKSIERG